jgi:hypothetical protein
VEESSAPHLCLLLLLSLQLPGGSLSLSSVALSPSSASQECHAQSAFGISVGYVCFETRWLVAAGWAWVVKVGGRQQEARRREKLKTGREERKKEIKIERERERDRHRLRTCAVGGKTTSKAGKNGGDSISHLCQCHELMFCVCSCSGIWCFGCSWFAFGFR